MPGSESSKESVAKWLHAKPLNSTKSALNGLEHDFGIIGGLRQSCEKLLRNVWKRKRTDSDLEDSAKFSLEESTSHLFLWGRSFDLGELDGACHDFEEVRMNILALLVEIGGLLVRFESASELFLGLETAYTCDTPILTVMWISRGAPQQHRSHKLKNFASSPTRARTSFVLGI